MQLEPARGLDVTVTGADLAAVTVTALFDNGWCRKLDRSDAIFTADDLPVDDATVLVESPGLTPVVLFSSAGTRELSALLRPTVTVSGNCPRQSVAAHVVHWESTHEKREAVADATGDFRFENVAAVDADALMPTLTQDMDDGCREVLVTSPAGVPLKDAEIDAHHHARSNDALQLGESGRTYTTDEKGRACVEGEVERRGHEGGARADADQDGEVARPGRGRRGVSRPHRRRREAAGAPG